MKIVIREDGPCIVEGGIPLDRLILKGDGEVPVEYVEVEAFEIRQSYALCRCGLSKKKPFCDGSHREGFNGAITYKDKDYYQSAEIIEGRDLILYDNNELCSGARFCMGDKSTWVLIFSKDEERRRLAIKQVENCPSGRLVLKDREGKDYEPKLSKSISILEDVSLKISGPLWVKGGIPIETISGESFKPRNRVTLCRCGHSKRKPLCDRSHVSVKFRDESFYRED